MGWFADPIYFGDYPPSMRDRVGERLPTFTDEEKALVMGSNDFLGFNHYTTWSVSPSGVVKSRFCFVVIQGFSCGPFRWFDIQRMHRIT